ncbi:hypothetical protein PJ267_08350 [Arthrobacter sp. OVS8]|nr:hypothetical protein PJ267_08350 [Arthrobacter sp. OVS8]
MDENRVDETPAAVDPNAANPATPDSSRSAAESRRPRPATLMS